MRRSGRLKATTAVDDRYFRILARKNPESNATMLNNAFRAATGCRVSTQTVRTVGCMMSNFTPDVHGEVHI